MKPSSNQKPATAGFFNETSGADMPDSTIHHAFNFADSKFWTFCSMLWLGVFGKYMLAEEDIRWKQMMGELIFATLLAIVIWAAGMLKGLEGMEMVLVGGLAGLGLVRGVQWTLKLVLRLIKVVL